ncbi:hypothetical protein [Streptomyces sp. ALI-76-A]|uniref:hypothetical protein n=1 Tax=Streptomyces sp. ALI-76-A TaxID=3025736 RepID=UPI00256EE8D4|nr:hypothetical protein [Streptomyces sp. ALI-76-A]MDL5201572.1 hypothetical protein [Streptomyces sp. ALI-76-A]
MVVDAAHQVGDAVARVPADRTVAAGTATVAQEITLMHSADDTLGLPLKRLG